MLLLLCVSLIYIKICRTRFQQIVFPTLNACVGRLRLVTVHHGREIVTALLNRK